MWLSIRICSRHFPFSRIQAPDLSDWLSSGLRGDHPQWQNVLTTLGKFTSRRGLADLAKNPR